MLPATSWDPLSRSLGKLDEAAEEYRRVLRIRPPDPVVRNSLGTIL